MQDDQQVVILEHRALGSSLTSESVSNRIRNRGPEFWQQWGVRFHELFSATAREKQNPQIFAKAKNNAAAGDDRIAHFARSSFPE
jgi:hypothetical protein